MADPDVTNNNNIPLKDSRDSNDGRIRNPVFIVSEEDKENNTSQANGSGKISNGNVVRPAGGGGGARAGAGRLDLTWEEKQEKLRIMKNIIIISLAFVFLFTSYGSVANLQASINKVDGTVSQTALYIAMDLSCLFLPAALVKTLKEKYTLILAMLCYAAYVAAQFYPRVYILVPTGIILGIGAAPLWAAKCTYLTKVGTRYAELSGEDVNVVLSRFFGIFFLFFQSASVWGNLITSAVLSVGVDSTGVRDEDILDTCGYNFCITEYAKATSPVTNVTLDNLPVSSNTTMNSGPSSLPIGPSLWKIYALSTVFLCCSLLSAVVMLFVDPVSSFQRANQRTQNDDKGPLELLGTTLNHMRHPYQLLLIPLTLWSGFEQQFLTTDYTVAYITCSLGVHMLGYVLICHGVCDAICCVLMTSLMKVVGRVPVFTLAFIINVVIILVLIYWRPHPDDLPWFFVVAALWGIADSVWQTQTNALYGFVFPGQSEAAFSNYRLWESVGLTIAWATSSILCIKAKVAILIASLLVGVSGYYTIEIMERRGGPVRDKHDRVVPIDRLMLGRY